MDNVVIESFIQHCDEMMIAEEGLGDKVKRLIESLMAMIQQLIIKFKKIQSKNKSKEFLMHDFAKEYIKKLQGAELVEDVRQLEEEFVSKEKSVSSDKYEKIPASSIYADLENTYRLLRKSLSSYDEVNVAKAKFLIKIYKSCKIPSEKNSENVPSITPEFKDAVEKKKKLRIRIMLKDILLVDKTFRSFNDMAHYAQSSGIDIWDSDDKDTYELPQDKKEWTTDLLNKLFVEVVQVFTKKKIQNIKTLIKYIYNK